MTTTRHVSTTALLGVLFLSATAALAVPQVEVDGRPATFGTPLLQVEDTILASMRDIGQALGANVRWNAATETVTASRGTRTVRIIIGSNRAVVDGQSEALPTPAVLRRGVAMVPLEFVCQALGAVVRWSDYDQVMDIYTEGAPDDEPYDDSVTHAQTVVVPRGSVIQVDLDMPLNTSTSTRRDSFTATVRPNQDGEAAFPLGTSFVGTALRVSGPEGQSSRSWDVRFSEAVLPDGLSIAIDGLLVTVGTPPADRPVGTPGVGPGGELPLVGATDWDAKLGVRLNEDATYALTDYDATWPNGESTYIPQGTVVPVRLDRALGASTSTGDNAFRVTIRPDVDGESVFPGGTQFVGTAELAPGADADMVRNWSVRFVEAQMPDGGTTPIEGSLLLVAGAPSTSDLPAGPAQYVMLMDSDARYASGAPIDSGWDNTTTVYIPEGTVIPVTLDRALDSATSTSQEAFRATIIPNHDGHDEFPSGTQFVGTATRASRSMGRGRRSWRVSFSEARVPDGATVPIDGTLISLDDTLASQTVTDPLTSRDGEAPYRVVNDNVVEYGLLVNTEVRYSMATDDVAPPRTQTVHVNEGTVIPVSLDRALDWATTGSRDAFTATIRSETDGDAEFPRGTQFVGTAQRLAWAQGRTRRAWAVDFVEARMPDGSTTPIDGSLVALAADGQSMLSGDTPATAFALSRSSEAPTRVVGETGEYGMLVNSDMSYSAPWRYAIARAPADTPSYDDRWPNGQTMVIPLGAVIPVSLDGPLSSAASNAGDAFSVTVLSSRDGDAEFPLGTRLLGAVTGVSRAGGGQPGMLDLAFREATLPNGLTLLIDGSATSLDERTVTRLPDGRLMSTSTPSSDDRSSVIGIAEGIGLLIGTLRGESTVAGGVLGADSNYSYGEYRVDEVETADAAMDEGAVFGVRMDREVSYRASWAFSSARRTYINTH